MEGGGRQALTALDYPRSAVSVGKYLVGSPVAHPLRATCLWNVISLVPSGSIFSSTAAWATAGN